jgi:hypothetical protein
LPERHDGVHEQRELRRPGMHGQALRVGGELPDDARNVLEAERSALVAAALQRRRPGVG